MTLGGRPALRRFETKNAISKRSIHQYVSIDGRFFGFKSTKDGLPYVQREGIRKELFSFFINLNQPNTLDGIITDP